MRLRATTKFKLRLLSVLLFFLTVVFFAHEYAHIRNLRKLEFSSMRIVAKIGAQYVKDKAESSLYRNINFRDSLTLIDYSSFERSIYNNESGCPCTPECYEALGTKSRQRFRNSVTDNIVFLKIIGSYQDSFRKISNITFAHIVYEPEGFVPVHGLFNGQVDCCNFDIESMTAQSQKKWQDYDLFKSRYLTEPVLTQVNGVSVFAVGAPVLQHNILIGYFVLGYTNRYQIFSAMNTLHFAVLAFGMLVCVMTVILISPERLRSIMWSKPE